MLRPDRRVTSFLGEFAGLAEEFFDLPREFGHGCIMMEHSGGIAEHWPMPVSLGNATSLSERSVPGLCRECLQTERLRVAYGLYNRTPAPC